MPKLTQARLKELLHYDPESGLFTWRVTINSRAQTGKTAGSTNLDGYVQIKITGILYFAHRLAYLYVYGYFPEHGIDHRDRKPWHNWIVNLREVSQQCNVRNSGNRSTNVSGVKGVSWQNQTKQWYAQIAVNGKGFNLGRYNNFADAVCARLAGEQCLDWSGCDSSSPAYKYVKKMLWR